MITEGYTAIPLETTRRAFRNQEKSKQILTRIHVYFTIYNAEIIEKDGLSFQDFRRYTKPKKYSGNVFLPDFYPCYLHFEGLSFTS